MPIENLRFFQDVSAIFSVLSNISDGFAFIDNDWKILFWNKSAERITGASKETIVNSNIWEQFQLTPDSIFYIEYHRAKNEKVTVEFETFFQPMQKWLQITAYPTAEGLAIYFKDITERKNFEFRILNHKKQTEALINASSDVIYSVDRNFCLLAANNSFIRNTYLYSNREIKIGDCVLEIMGKEEGDKWRSFYEQALNGESVTHDRLIMYQVNGEAVYTEIYFNPIKDEETGEIAGVACYARDVTASKRYIALIEDKNARLQQSDVMLQEAVDSLTRQNLLLKEIAFIQSHEVRRPLANILGLIEILADQKGIENEYIKYLKKSSEELDAMIKKIVLKTSEISMNADSQN